MSITLYELTKEYKQVQDLIEEGGEGLEDTLQSNRDAIEIKAENYAKIIKNIEGNVNVLKEEEKRLAGRRNSLENEIVRMKQALEDGLRTANMTKIKGQLFTIAIQKNPPSVNVLNETKIPKKYWIPQPSKLNQKQLFDDLKAGKKYPGIAEIKQGESLRIR